MTTTLNGSDLAVLRDEVAALRSTVDHLRAELARRDVEQMELEAAFEHEQSKLSAVRCVLRMVVVRTFGDEPSIYGGDKIMELLRRPGLTWWHRPARRWSQFGSRKALLDLAAKHGVNIRRGDSREWIIRALWQSRAAHADLPGGVGPFEEDKRKHEAFLASWRAERGEGSS